MTMMIPIIIILLEHVELPQHTLSGGNFAKKLSGCWWILSTHYQILQQPLFPAWTAGRLITGPYKA